MYFNFRLIRKIGFYCWHLIEEATTKKSTFFIVLFSNLTEDGCISQLFVGWQFQFRRINEIFVDREDSGGLAFS